MRNTGIVRMQNVEQVILSILISIDTEDINVVKYQNHELLKFMKSIILNVIYARQRNI